MGGWQYLPQESVQDHLPPYFYQKVWGAVLPTFAEQGRVRKGEQSQQAAPGRRSPWAMPSAYVGPGVRSWEAGQLQSLQVSLVYVPLDCPG